MGVERIILITAPNNERNIRQIDYKIAEIEITAGFLAIFPNHSRFNGLSIFFVYQFFKNLGYE